MYKQRAIRLQSTACEQHRWDAILKELGADLFYNLAIGESCIIHDKSERERETRACWQGLSWVRYACHRTWRVSEPPMEFSRGGMPLNPYWEEQYKLLSRGTRHLVRYFKKFDKGGMLDMYSCYTPPVVRRIHAKADTELVAREAIVVNDTPTNEGGHTADLEAAAFPARSLSLKLIALPFEG